MSPEQARGHEVDKRTDIWAFGCCLFECLSGRKPFQGQTASDLMAEVLKSDPDWTQLPLETPQAVMTLLRRCLEKEPSRRLSSIGDIAITLDESTRGSVPSSPSQAPQPPATPPPSLSPTGAPARRLWPVAAGLLILIIGAGIYFWKRPGADRNSQVGSDAGKTNVVPLSSAASVADQKSIAVLAFANLSEDKGNEYFSDGISEELLNVLAKIPGLKVSARTSAFFFKGKQAPMAEIAKQLDVAYIVESSVRKSGSRVRITAQLIKAADGFHVWSDNFDRELKDIFAVQDEIAGLIAKNLSLKMQLLADGGPNGLRDGTDNLEAYDLFLRGRQLWNKRTGADIESAIACFQQATGKDPKFALAYAGLGSCYVVLPIFADRAVQEVVPKARAAARRALELDPRLVEAHTVMARCLDFEGDLAGAEKGYSQALALNPNYAILHQWYGLFLADSGSPEQGLVEIRLAQALDPLSVPIRACVGIVLKQNRRYEEALAQMDQVLQLSPDFPYAYMMRGLLKIAQRKFPEAIAELEKESLLGGIKTSYVSGLLGHCYAATDRANEARQIIAQLKVNATKGGSVATCIAFVYHGFRDKEQVFAWLGRAAPDPIEKVRALKYDPLWDDVTADPRYAALLKKHGLDK